MRPTLLMFRSPKERTPGYHDIKVKNDGTNLDYGALDFFKYKFNNSFNGRIMSAGRQLKKKSNNILLYKQPSNFSQYERFPEYRILKKKTPADVGPGCYNVQRTLDLLKQKPCPSKIKHSYFGKVSGTPGYIFIGNQLVYDEELAQRSQSRGRQVTTSQLSNRSSQKQESIFQSNIKCRGHLSKDVIIKKNLVKKNAKQRLSMQLQHQTSQNLRDERTTSGTRSQNNQDQANGQSYRQSFDLKRAQFPQKTRQDEITQLRINQVNAVNNKRLGKKCLKKRDISYGFNQRRKSNDIQQIVDTQMNEMTLGVGSQVSKTQTSNRANISQDSQRLIYGNQSVLQQMMIQNQKGYQSLYQYKGQNNSMQGSNNTYQREMNITNINDSSTQAASMNNSNVVKSHHIY
ncbi:UNKNOWN [Stylonychia lemnae]|uniref:Uncharacterized protein n=1 Tax=Stylonychia lemnae TaxID=5949 RepID=A0A078AK10_STYLE|nr:UNKNOWN [Stylonychia lemnae]|eukprot:CDW81792.1 UNKNOWN [Stylonychia lemnae]